MSTQTTFDILLLSRDGVPADAGAVLGAIEGSGRAFRLRADPGHYLWRNDDTGVHFHVTVAPGIAASRAPPGEDGNGEDTENEEEEEEEESDEEDMEEDEPFDVVMAPVVITLPLLVPPFFLAEAVELALHVAESASLVLESPAIEASAGEAPAAGRTAAEIIAAWAGASQAAILALGDGAGVTTWPPEKAAQWWDYGRRRALLEADLAPEDIAVPPLRAALHEGKVKSLVIWETSRPTVLPRADLVLVRKEGGRRGLLGIRRAVEEGIIPGDKVWELLAPFSEHRAEPAEILIFRSARTPPSPVAAALEVMRLEPLESVRRTELTGVVAADDSPEAKTDG